MTTILFTSANPSLAKLAVYSSNQDWVNLKLSNVKAEDKEAFLSVLKEIAPSFQAEDQEALQVASVRYKDGQFQRCYPVSLYSTENKTLAIKLGQQIVELENLLDAQIELFEVEKYEDPCLVITQETPDGDVNILPLPLRLNDLGRETFKTDSKVFIKKINIALKKNNLAATLVLADFLLVATSGGTSGGPRLELVDIKELPIMEAILVTSVKPVTTKFGQSFVLNVIHPSNQVEVQIWCPSNLKKIFALGGQLTPGKSFLKYSVYQNKSGKELIDATLSNIQVLDSEGDADIASLF